MKKTRPTYYILDGHRPVPVDMMVWAKGSQERTGDWRVAQNYIGDIHISTVFLGLDHSFGVGPPLLFETMIFGGEHDQYQTRCSTWEEAEAMHKAALNLVKNEDE